MPSFFNNLVASNNKVVLVSLDFLKVPLRS